MLVGASAHAEPATVTPRAFVHIRPEVRTNPGFVAGQEDAVVAVLQSARVGVEAEKGPFLAVVDLQGTQAWGGRSGSTGTEPTVYPYQGYLQAGTGESWLRFGRQELHLLNGFHMSAAPWNVAGRTFDGVRGHLSAGDWEVDAFSVVLSAPFAKTDTTATLGNTVTPSSSGPSLGSTHAGLLATWAVSEQLSLTPMALARFTGPTLDDPDNQLWWVTPGARLYATPGQTMIDLNALALVGDDTDVPMRGYSVILRARQGLGDGKLQPGVGLIFEQNSGHACTSDPSTGACDTDTIGDFQTGFGRNHFLRGNADQFHGSNLRDIGLEVDSTPWTGGKKRAFKTLLQGHLFQLANPEGAWRTAGGALQGSGWEVGNTDPNLAWEVDALFDLVVTSVAHIDGGICVVQPIGVGARLAGPDAMTYAFARNRFVF